MERHIEAGMESRGYFCIRRLGKGAFSEVYRAEDREGRLCACKVSGNVRLLEREARVMEGLAHPLFPEFFEFWVHGGPGGELGYLAMEYVEGECLADILGRRGGFCARQVVRTGLELAEGLRYLHERAEGYLFRDVKPANIILRQDGKVKLLDFGCVCLEGERGCSLAGTPGYGAPEQLEEGGFLTQACDVYGLGRTLQEMLGGRRRRGGASLGASVRIPRGDHPSRCASRAGKRSRLRDRRELERFLEACTRRDLTERIADMRTVMAALLELEGGDTWKGEALCRKNIWDSMYKMS